MKKVLLLLVVFALCTKIEAQDYWQGSTTVTTSTMGKVGIGTGKEIPATSLQINDAKPFITLKSLGGIYDMGSVYGKLNLYYNGINFEGKGKFALGTTWNPNLGGEIFEIANRTVASATAIRFGTGYFDGVNSHNVYIGSAVFKQNGGVQLKDGKNTLKLISSISSGNANLVFESNGNLSDIIYNNGLGTMKGMLRVSTVNNVLTMRFSEYNAGTIVKDLFKVGSDGIFYAHQISVMEATFPDYVFDSEYKLMPLSEVSKYIIKNHRLPNTASAEEIKEKGLLLGDMQCKQMEKIEELMLYILQQQRVIDEIKKTLTAQQEWIAAQHK